MLHTYLFRSPPSLHPSVFRWLLRSSSSDPLAQLEALRNNTFPRWDANRPLATAALSLPWDTTWHLDGGLLLSRIEWDSTEPRQAREPKAEYCSRVIPSFRSQVTCTKGIPEGHRPAWSRQQRLLSPICNTCNLLAHERLHSESLISFNFASPISYKCYGSRMLSTQLLFK